MAKIIIYTKNWCGYCTRAKNLLKGKSVNFDEIDVSSNYEILDNLINKTGWRTLPQIFINDKFIGGFDDLYTLDRNGSLDKLLQE